MTTKYSVPTARYCIDAFSLDRRERRPTRVPGATTDAGHKADCIVPPGGVSRPTGKFFRPAPKSAPGQDPPTNDEREERWGRRMCLSLQGTHAGAALPPEGSSRVDQERMGGQAASGTRRPLHGKQ